MSIMVPSAGGVELLKRILYGRGAAITGATNATPIVITSNAHGLSNGMSVTIAGVGGNTAANGTFTVASVATNTFALTTAAGANVAGNGTYTSGGIWTINALENAALKLYSSNTTPAESDTAGTYTEVSNGSGYTTGGQTLISLDGDWAVPATVGSGGTGGWASSLGTNTGSSNIPESTYTALSWSWTGSVTAYGYFVVGSNSSTIWWSERFSNPPKNFASGDSLSLTPRLGLTHS